VDERVHDGFQTAHGGVIVQDDFPKPGAVQNTVLDDAREGGVQGGDGFAAWGLQSVDSVIGIERRDAEAREHFGDGGFAHADAAGEAQN
jgi:hypothetical protein